MARSFSGQRFRAARRAAGLPAERLALDVGRSVWTIHAYELGRAKPPLDVAAAVADRLGVPIDAFLTGEPARAAVA